MNRRPSFAVVSFVVTVLVFLGVMRQLLRPYIPQIPQNRMAAEDEGFLLAGMYEPIPWVKGSVDAFAEARRRQRPILLFIGVIPSRGQRLLDDLFMDRTIGQFVAREFSCVRIDAREYPAWRNAFLPLSRIETGLQTDCQLWVLAPNGEPITFLPRPSRPLDVDEVRGQLQQALNQINSSMLSERQNSDLSLLRDPRQRGRVDLSAYRSTLAAQLADGDGNYRRPWPGVLKFLLANGESLAASAYLRSLTDAGLVDAVEGGFFAGIAGSNPGTIEFDKATLLNAEGAAALAYGSDPWSRYLAERGLQRLETALSQRDFLTAGEIGEVNAKERSPRHSYPPRRLGEVLASEQVPLVTEALALDPISNPQLAPKLNQVPDPNLEALLKQLTPKSPARWCEGDYADIHLGALARMLEASRLLGTAERIQRLSEKLDRTSTYFRMDNGMRHRANVDDSPGSLADYLAYADAKLQDYLATGRYTSLQEGAAVLTESVRVFERTPGEFTLAQSDEPPLRRAPELYDDHGESTTAKGIRLLLGYSRVLADRPEGRAFLKEAYNALYRYAEITRTAGPAAASFYSVATDAVDDTYAVVVGPDAQKVANRLLGLVPTRLVIPAIGDVRRDLAPRGNGVYVIRGTVRGPFTVERALPLLRSTVRTSG